MITRFEADGFKNLRNFSCEFGPYTCIAGPNAVGKSNIFDALTFLSATANRTFNDAAASLRGHGGDVEDLFAAGYDKIFLAAEMLVTQTVTDDYQRTEKLDHTYLRYELTVAKHNIEVASGGSVSTLVLDAEKLEGLTRQHSRDQLGWIDNSSKKYGNALKFSRRTTPMIDTETGEHRRVKVYQVGRKGRPAEVPLDRQPIGKSTLSEFGRIEYPFVAAAKAELSSWLALSLEPSAMRSPSEATAPDHISAQGGNLPKTLYRLSDSGKDVSTLESLTDSVRDLVNIGDIDLDFDPSRQIFTLRAKVGDAPMLPARSLSDGTLRFIALSMLYLDPEFGGLVCFEEPENGIHPRKMQHMYRLLKDVVDPDGPAGSQGKLRQVIVNTHSPSYIFQHGEDLDNLMIASTVPRTNSLQLSPVRVKKSWRRSEEGQVPPNLVVELMEESFPNIDFGSWGQFLESHGPESVKGS